MAQSDTDVPEVDELDELTESPGPHCPTTPEEDPAVRPPLEELLFEEFVLEELLVEVLRLDELLPVVEELLFELMLKVIPPMDALLFLFTTSLLGAQF